MTLSRTISDDRGVRSSLPADPPALPDATEIVSAAMQWALRESAQACGAGASEDAVRGLRQHDARTHGAFSYHLAKYLAGQIAGLDSRVKAVYLYDCDAASGDDCFTETAATPLIHMIVWAQPKSSALSSIIAALDGALARAYGDLLPESAGVHLLDAQVIDDDVVASRSGYGALLSSPHYRPLRLWQKP